jgi:hypothetical protein
LSRFVYVIHEAAQLRVFLHAVAAPCSKHERGAQARGRGIRTRQARARWFTGGGNNSRMAFLNERNLVRELFLRRWVEAG